MDQTGVAEIAGVNNDGESLGGSVDATNDELTLLIHCRITTTAYVPKTTQIRVYIYAEKPVRSVQLFL